MAVGVLDVSDSLPVIPKSDGDPSKLVRLGGREVRNLVDDDLEQPFRLGYSARLFRHAHRRTTPGARPEMGLMRRSSGFTGL